MTITAIQDKQIASELKAIGKHGKGSLKARTAILSARTRAIHALVSLGFNRLEARRIISDAADMVTLQLESK